jgi:cytochrome c-type biogenesis protein CcmH
MIVLWIAMAVLAAAASLAVLTPLYRPLRRAQSERAQALAIYRDQLDEVERDLGRGVIAASEADAARTEIARRLIKAGGEAKDDAPARGTGPQRAATAAIIAMPLAAFVFYLWVGSPELPAEPLAARLAAPPDQQDVATLMARVEAHLAANPDDGKGWEVLAPVYARMGRWEEAVAAYRNVVRLLGSTADREADLGEALTAQADGTVTADARAAFNRAAKLDPNAARPRFYLALALGQEGKKDEAIAAWHALLADAPADAGWVPVARQQLASLQDAAEAPGPSEADVQAAGDMTPEQRLAMIEGMVGSLAAKLEANPADGEGWARLVRSYMVLGRPADAKAALAKARTALAADAEALAKLNDTAREAGVPE